MGLVAVFQDEGPFRLLIVDSIMALFRTDYEARRAADDIRRLLDPRVVATPRPGRCRWS